MNGPMMLLGFAGLAGLVFFLATDGSMKLKRNLSVEDGLVLLGREKTGPSEPPARLARVADTRHAQIRSALMRDGYDVTNPDHLVFERDGKQIVGGPVAATEHGRAVFLEDIFFWYQYPRISDQPAREREIPAVQECLPAPPAEGARVANVYTDGTLQRVSAFAYSEDEIDALARAHLDHVARNGAQAQPGLLEVVMELGSLPAGTQSSQAEPYQFTAMEVVVTETEMPVHLVLQTGAGRVMWNLSMAPGVEISGVTLLGGAISAITNLPKGVPVEVMPARLMADCGVVRAHRPLFSDPLFAALEAGETGVAETQVALAERRPAIEAWNAWFEARFGVRDDATRIGYDTASIAALVGPLPPSPAERVGYHGFDGRRIWIGPAAGTMLTDGGGAEVRLRARVEKRASELAEDYAALGSGGN